MKNSVVNGELVVDPMGLVEVNVARAVECHWKDTTSLESGDTMPGVYCLSKSNTVKAQATLVVKCKHQRVIGSGRAFESISPAVPHRVPLLVVFHIFGHERNSERCG